MLLDEYLKNRRFLRLQKHIATSVQPYYRQILQNADHAVIVGDSDDAIDAEPIVRLGRKLRNELLEYFRFRCVEKNRHRYLIHLPPETVSPAGYSWFASIAESLAYLGIPVRILSWHDSTEEALVSFQPTILLTSDALMYLSRLDWSSIASYRKRHSFFVGLTASLAEYGNTPLSERLAWASRHCVSFYYSFRSAEYIKTRKEYTPFFDAGYTILNLEFAANPLRHYPAGASQKLVDYVFLGSINYSKWGRYNEYFTNIVRQYKGFVAGPGWPFASDYTMKSERDRCLYAQARIGLNLSIEEQVNWPCELNERTYILAACGIPQLIDNPQLLSDRFSADAMFSATNPRAYYRLFQEMLGAPDECSSRAIQAMEEVFAKHTTFHRVEAFARQLEALL